MIGIIDWDRSSTLSGRRCAVTGCLKFSYKAVDVHSRGEALSFGSHWMSFGTVEGADAAGLRLCGPSPELWPFVAHALR
ncbi:hypothetical protein AXG93_4332s1230 [Marchantia polymorpha subsp. ruderalis]|uniref:Uncharacterized protein n=1 Tax=Marchantia polymorpha subsp. ruderalis TaxID=1480154 RepID=A0A176W439_MARPO|nr:hypothetical protein AXG93_4332s1230 [Marchantia polymorpha subsp. ruderalis]